MRRVVKSDKRALEIKPLGESVWICMCGLSKNQPFCDGPHKTTRDEEDGKTYEYDTECHRRRFILEIRMGICWNSSAFCPSIQIRVSMNCIQNGKNWRDRARAELPGRDRDLRGGRRASDAGDRSLLVQIGLLSRTPRRAFRAGDGRPPVSGSMKIVPRLENRSFCRHASKRTALRSKRSCRDSVAARLPNEFQASNQQGRMSVDRTRRMRGNKAQTQRADSNAIKPAPAKSSFTSLNQKQLESPGRSFTRVTTAMTSGSGRLAPSSSDSSLSQKMSRLSWKSGFACSFVTDDP